MGYKRKIFISIFAAVAILIISGCGCKQKSQKSYDLKLEIWGMLDDKDAIGEIIDNYRKINPNVAEVEYKKISANTYEKELTDALASGQGPDIFMIHNDWVPNFKNKIVPVPKTGVAGLVTEQKFKSNFVDVVAADFMKGGEIYAMPLSVDSLALYYNRDLFNQAGIVAPPKDWNEFIEDVRKLTKVDAYGEVQQSGAAIGTAYNINRSTDLLNLLMLQNNTLMTDESGRVAFDSSLLAANGESFSPGENALNFYTQFAKSGSLNYTWNPRLHYSIDAFSEGTAAMMFNYSWHLKTIVEKSPKLNFAIAPVPQFDNNNRVNFANYWGYAVAKNKTPVSAGADQTNPNFQNITNDDRVKEAWLFLSYLTTKPDGSFISAPSSTVTGTGKTTDPNFDPASAYIKKMEAPAARRDLVEIQKGDPKIGVFAADNLISKSWTQADPNATESIFAEMIDQVNKGQLTVSEALKAAAQRVGRLATKQ